MINFKKIGLFGLSALATFAFASSVKANPGDVDAEFNKFIPDGTYIVNGVESNDGETNSILIAHSIMQTISKIEKEDFVKYYVEVNLCDWEEDPETHDYVCNQFEKDADGYWNVGVYLQVTTDEKDENGDSITKSDEKNIKI